MDLWTLYLLRLQEYSLSAAMECSVGNGNNNFTLLAAKQQNDASEGVHSPSDNHYAHSLICAVLSHTDIDTDLHSPLCAC